MVSKLFFTALIMCVSFMPLVHSRLPTVTPVGHPSSSSGDASDILEQSTIDADFTKPARNLMAESPTCLAILQSASCVNSLSANCAKWECEEFAATKLSNGTYKSIGGIASAARCCELCIKDTKCTAYTWKPGSDEKTGICRLLNKEWAYITKTPDDLYTSGRKKCIEW